MANSTHHISWDNTTGTFTYPAAALADHGQDPTMFVKVTGIDGVVRFGSMRSERVEPAFELVPHPLGGCDMVAIGRQAAVEAAYSKGGRYRLRAYRDQSPLIRLKLLSGAACVAMALIAMYGAIGLIVGWAFAATTGPEVATPWGIGIGASIGLLGATQWMVERWRYRTSLVSALAMFLPAAIAVVVTGFRRSPASIFRVVAWGALWGAALAFLLAWSTSLDRLLVGGLSVVVMIAVVFVFTSWRHADRVRRRRALQHVSTKLRRDRDSL